MEKLTSQLQAAKRSLQELASQRDEIVNLHQGELAAKKEVENELDMQKNKLSELQNKLSDLETQHKEKSESCETMQKTLTKYQVKFKEVQGILKVRNQDKNWLISSLVKILLSVREVLGSISGPVKLNTMSPMVRHLCDVLLSFAAQAVSRGDGPRHSLHASAQV